MEARYFIYVFNMIISESQLWKSKCEVDLTFGDSVRSLMYVEDLGVKTLPPHRYEELVEVVETSDEDATWVNFDFRNFTNHSCLEENFRADSGCTGGVASLCWLSNACKPPQGGAGGSCRGKRMSGLRLFQPPQISCRYAV